MLACPSPRRTNPPSTAVIERFYPPGRAMSVPISCPGHQSQKPSLGSTAPSCDELDPGYEGHLHGSANANINDRFENSQIWGISHGFVRVGSD